MAETLTLERNAVPLAAPHAPPEGQSILSLAVPDMHCGGCMRKVERALLAVSGVAAARSNLSEKRVTVVTSGKSVDVEALIGALDRIGFPATILADAGQRQQPTDDNEYFRRLGVAAFAAANIMLLSVSVWSGHGADMPATMKTAFHWLSALIALPAITYAGQPFFRSARRAITSRRLNMDVPISLGVILATAMSLYQTMRGNDQVYFDAAITLLFFLLIGRALDEGMRRRAAGAANNLLGLRSPVATVVQSDGRTARLPTVDVQPGDRLLVAAGERLPVDARLVRGASDIDESLINGETRPRSVSPGASLYAGTINLSAPIEMEATTAADNTLLSEIARMMAVAEQARGRYVRLADRAARFYAPAVHVLAAGTFVGWLAAGHGWEPALTAAIAVLIITCPCALALAVPAVQVVAASRLFRGGVILKAADGLERLAEVDTVVLDKTGTLTAPDPELVDAERLPTGILAKAAALACRSRHPYARAVVRAVEARSLPLPQVTEVRELPGAGLTGTIDGERVRLGSAAHCEVASPPREETSLWYRAGENVPIELAVREALRPDAPATVSALRDKGYCVELLSGDRRESVSEIAAACGIEVWNAAQKPQDKLARLAILEKCGRRVLMVGDGLNDAPALAAGHASLAPSNAADISQTAADALLQGSRLAPIVLVLDIAKAARRRALENFAIAIGYNVLFVPLAVAGLVTPLIAAVAMSASSLAVTANALRLARTRTEASR